MENYQATIDRMKVVRRFLIPAMADDPIPGRPRRFGLSAADMDIVVHGYACPSCLACWEGDTTRLICPVCGHQRSAADFLSKVKEWDDYRDYVADQIANPQKTEVKPMHEYVEEMMDEVGEGWRPGVKKNL